MASAEVLIIVVALLSIGVLRRTDADLEGVYLGDEDEDCSAVAHCIMIDHVECVGGDCVCAAGFMQNSTSEYTKQECVPVVTKSKSHGDACTWGECLGYYVCKHGRCTCPDHSPHFVPMSRECVGSSYGEPCYDPGYHLDEEDLLSYYHGYCLYDDLQCNDDVCTCGGWENWHEDSTSCERPYEGQTCADEYIRLECHSIYYDESHLECVEGQENGVRKGKCVCADGYPDWNLEKRKCLKRRLGDPCTVPEHRSNSECVESTECVGGVCECTQATPLPDHVTKTCSAKPKFGQKCTKDECEPDDLSCQNSVCACKNASLEFNGVACRSRTKKSLGERCGGVDICNAERGLVCEVGNCKCGAGRSWVQNLCQLDPIRCESESKTECSGSEGLHCDIEAQVCMCSEGKQLSKTSHNCKLMVGQACYENKTLRHDLCASDLCIGEDTATVALAGRCSCADFNGVKWVWSAEPGQGCVPDYFGLPCNPVNENRDCRFDNSRPNDALSRVEKNGGWFCACAQGKTHYQGFCVVADRPHGEICDPRGVGPTCSLDRNMTLVCGNGGSGPFTCGCGKKGVTFGNGTVEYGSMTWHDDTKQCELGRDGEVCTTHVDCQSGHCPLPGGRCDKAPEGKSGGGVMRRSIISILISTLSFHI